MSALRFAGRVLGVAVPPRAAKKSKYNNVRTMVGTEKFDSVAEAVRYQALVLLQRSGAISSLTRQASFVLAPKAVINGVPKRALIYRADFSYIDAATGGQVIEDVKGALTEIYKLKRHLMKSIHNIDILETR